MWIKNAAKSGLISYPRAFSVLQKIYQAPRIVASKFRYKEEYFLDRIAQRGGNVRFLQIGAHDGKTDDVLHSYILQYHWRGVLVEPVARLFEQLKYNYQTAAGLEFENVAISDHDGVEMFYRMDASAPPWCSQLGSCRREVVLAHKYMLPGFERFLIEERVKCISFKTLVERHDLTDLDIILIDTEGYDLQILRQVDFARVRPELVIYEQQHLSRDDKRKAIDLLAASGYETLRVGSGWNNVAVRRQRR